MSELSPYQKIVLAAVTEYRLAMLSSNKPWHGLCTAVRQFARRTARELNHDYQKTSWFVDECSEALQDLIKSWPLASNDTEYPIYVSGYGIKPGTQYSRCCPDGEDGAKRGEYLTLFREYNTKRLSLCKHVIRSLS